MQTIEEIKITRNYFKRIKDNYGNVTREPYQAKVRREVELVFPTVRLGYFLLDLFFYYFLSILIIYSTLIISLSISPDNYSFANFVRNNETIISYSFFFLYYALSEFFFGGTIGKLICGYRVINQYAEKIKFEQALLRTIIRYIPFEFLTCIGERAWHDKWTKTYVVKKKEKVELQKLLNTFNEFEDILD